MKINITITKEEVDNTIDILEDPCNHINCGEIDCECCPFRTAAEELRKAQERFRRVLDEIEVAEE